MSEQRDVKVFISWSGDLAREIAVALREWLPLLFDRVEPWASDTDIAAGQRGLNQIEAELADTQFGIVVVTAANQDAPWLNFEAGALSKTIVGDLDQRVVPLLVDLSSPSQLTGPLAQFQAKVADEAGMRALLRSLAAVAGIQERVVEERFSAYWPRLHGRISGAIEEVSSGQPSTPRRPQADVLEEILLHVRQLRSESEVAHRSPRYTVGTPTMYGGAGKVVRELAAEIAAEHGLELLAYSETPKEMVLSVGPASPEGLWDLKRFRKDLTSRIPLQAHVSMVQPG